MEIPHPKRRNRLEETNNGYYRVGKSDRDHQDFIPIESLPCEWSVYPNPFLERRPLFKPPLQRVLTQKKNNGVQDWDKMNNKINKTLVIIPTYNEESTLRDVVCRIKNTLPESNVLVINDGSTDKTSEVAKSSGAMVLDLPYNLGIGNTIQTGFLFATQRGYDIVLRLDADGQHRPEDAKSIMEPVLNGTADMVVGSRFLLSNDGFKSTLVRRVGIKFFSTFVSLIIRKRVTDPTSGFQAMNEKAIRFFAREYPPDYPEIEALVLANKAGFIVKEVPVEMLERKGGQSSINFLNSIYYVLEVLTSIVVSIFRKL